MKPGFSSAGHQGAMHPYKSCAHAKKILVAAKR